MCIRDSVSIEEMPVDAVTAIVSIEDKKFFRHHGIDYRALLRAVTVSYTHLKAWRDYNGLHFIQCACKFTDTCTTCNNEENRSKRVEIKEPVSYTHLDVYKRQV